MTAAYDFLETHFYHLQSNYFKRYSTIVECAEIIFVFGDNYLGEVGINFFCPPHYLSKGYLGCCKSKSQVALVYFVCFETLHHTLLSNLMKRVENYSE